VPAPEGGGHGDESTSNLLRLLPAALAIAVGVGAIVLALGVSRGASQLAEGPTYGLSKNVVVVEGVAPSSTGIEAGLPASSLTQSDVDALSNPGYVPDGRSVAATAGLRTQVSSSGRSAETEAIGSTNAFAQVEGYSIDQGRFISASDLQSAAPVVVLGQSVVGALFAGSDPVGQTVQIDGQNFQVIGTFQARGYSDTYNLDNLVVLPITVAWKDLPPLQNTSEIDQILIKAGSPSAASSVANEAARALLQLHNISNPALADFTVLRQPQLVTDQTNSALAVRRVLEVIGACLVAVGVAWLALVLRRQRREARTEWALDDTIVTAALIGLASAALGIVIALVLAPTIQHLAADMPPAKLSPYGALAGAGIAVAAVVVSLVVLALFELKNRARA
jgi:putative ABC transport system permease protein